MTPDNSLAAGDGPLVLARAGRVYVVYLPKGGSAALKLADGAYKVRWFNPRAGGPLQTGSVPDIKGGGEISLGNAPADAGKDWAILVTREQPAR